MAQALVPGLACESASEVRRIRELPLPGELLVQSGDSVSGDQIVARASLPGDLHILRIAESMGIEPHEVMAGLKSMDIQSGSEVSCNQVICEHKGLFGLFRSQYTAPAAGTVEFIAERVGHVGLREAPCLLELNAYLAGHVVDLQAEKAVIIESRIAFVQGIFGVGGEKHGVISPLAIDTADHVTVDAIPSDCTQAILCGGASVSIDALKAASERGAVGFVCGSVDDRVLAEYLGYDLGIALTGDEELDMTLIITEGFGSIAMSDKVYELLKRFAGRTAAINGATQVRAGAVRPEILIPLDSTDSAEKVSKEKDLTRGLEVGSRVRGIRVPYFGQIGEVLELPAEAMPVETGAFVRVARVKLKSGKETLIPRANLEIL